MDFGEKHMKELGYGIYEVGHHLYLHTGVISVASQSIIFILAEEIGFINSSGYFSVVFERPLGLWPHPLQHQVRIHLA